MNDRIEELAQQANTDLDGAIPIGFAEKFAELLIRECANYVKGSSAFTYVSQAEDCAASMLKRFGVD